MSRNERWEVGERPSLDLRVPVGTVEVYAGDAGVVQLTIDATDADDFEVFKTGDRVSVRHPSRWGRRGRHTRIVAHVPAGTDLEISSTSGDVRLVGSVLATCACTARSVTSHWATPPRSTSPPHRVTYSCGDISMATPTSRRSRATAPCGMLAAGSMPR